MRSFSKNIPMSFSNINGTFQLYKKNDTKKYQRVIYVHVWRDTKVNNMSVSDEFGSLEETSVV